MGMTFLHEWIYGFLMLWINPVFYLMFVLSFMIGIRRVKEERRHFHVRVYDVASDLIQTVVPGLAVGGVLSLFFVGIGLALPEGVIVLLMSVMFLLGLPLRPLFLSPSVVMAVILLVSFFLPEADSNAAWLNRWIHEIQSVSYTSYFLLLASLLLAESSLILWQAKKQPSPRLIQSKRGKMIGVFETKRLWLVPAFILVPGLGLERFGWWPLFSDSDHFSMFLVPFVIGFQQFVTFTLPERAIQREGRMFAAYAVIVFPFAVASALLDWEWVAFAGIGLSLVVRLGLAAWIRRENRLRPFYFGEQHDGLMILGIIPHTPAAKMNVKIGEVVQKVNGVPVKHPDDFYRALQSNAAFCKLEIRDENGEVRFEQRALYHDDHHELGLLFANERRLR